MQEILFKIRYFERGLSESLKKVKFIFSFAPSPLYWTKLAKTKGVWNQWPVALQVPKQFKNIPLFVTYHLTKFDDVIQSSFWVIPKITSANLCKSIHDIINYSTSICPFESGKCEKKGKNLQKFEYLENEKCFLHKIKNIFIVFKGVSFGEKIKIW